MDFESLLLSAPWFTMGLWVALYLADRLLTIASARAHQKGTSEHHGHEGSMELTPLWVADVDAMRWFSPRFARVLVLTTLIVGGLCLIGGPFLAPENAGFQDFALFMLGLLFFPELAVCARHASNLAMFRRMNAHEGVEGKVTYARWLEYETSAVQLWGVACLLFVCALLGWKASLFGGAFGVAFLGLRHIEASRVQLAKASNLTRSRRAGLRWTLLVWIVALLVGITVWQSTTTPAPPPPPPGTVWFGTGYDSGLPGLTGRANTFTQGTTVWMTVDLNTPLSDQDGITVMIDGVAASNIPVDEGWQVFSTAVPGEQALGSHTVSIEDGQGTTRATGTFTISPAPIATH